jgi:pyruvate/2-oxoglutarate dehydrogenase complex dihydrolipoamide dehydrogenase (E3) component
MLDWLIVGAGIHGVHIARVLERHTRRLALLDPHEQPLARWDRLTAIVGMSHLRSPIDVDLDRGQLSLHHFADAQRDREDGWFSGRYRCPARAIFRRHVEWLCADSRLDALCERGRLLGLEPRGDHVVAHCDRGLLRARRVVLALGHPGLARPGWARGSDELHPFAAGFEPELEPGRRAIVVGGGLSAVQLALGWARRSPGGVDWVARRMPPIAELDADPRWRRPAIVERFARESVAGRHAILRAQRRASMPARVAARLARALRRGRLRVHVGEVVRREASGVLVLDDGRELVADRVATATGFAPASHMRVLAHLQDGLAAGCDEGLPILDAALRWHPRVHVSGALAQLQLGPLAATIAGARLAAQRLQRV